MSGPRAILCVHPHRELYGSDRTFVQSLRAFRARWPEARITAVLSGDGALHDAVVPHADEVVIEDLFVLRRRDALSALALPRLAKRVRAARRRMAQHDLVYVNTVVALDYLLASRASRTPALVHVHELPTGVARPAFSALLRGARAEPVFVSRTTRGAFARLGGRRGSVVWNGTLPRATPALAYGATLNILLIGRFNAWKGQGLLLDALALLSPQERARVRVRIVGSAFAGQERFTRAIHATVAARSLADTVSVHPFEPNPSAHYAWAHVVAVPSTRPEPFGLVAIEAMAAGRAVIAAAHGGLAEIVVRGETGKLVAPGSAAALADAIRLYLDTPALVGHHGARGRARFAAHFSENAYLTRIADAAAQAFAAGR